MRYEVNAKDISRVDFGPYIQFCQGFWGGGAASSFCLINVIPYQFLQRRPGFFVSPSLP